MSFALEVIVHGLTLALQHEELYEHDDYETHDMTTESILRSMLLTNANMCDGDVWPAVKERWRCTRPSPWASTRCSASSPVRWSPRGGGGESLQGGGLPYLPYITRATNLVRHRGESASLRAATLRCASLPDA